MSPRQVAHEIPGLIECLPPMSCCQASPNITVTAWLNTQNRLSNKDRVAASPDYKINQRAELKIMRLHKKMDELSFRFE